MRGRLLFGEKSLDWVGSSKRDFMRFPEPVRAELGNALGVAQFGGTHPSAKPWKGQGAGLCELVEDHDGTLVVPFTRSGFVMSFMSFTRSRRNHPAAFGPLEQTSNQSPGG